MKKGICFYFGYEAAPETRAKLLSGVGFECIMTVADPRYDHENGTIESQVELFKKYGLELSSLHMRYKSSELPEFWKENETGNRMEADLKDDVKVAAKYGFTCVVVHLLGEFNEIGIKRLERVLELCKELNVPLAIENINDPETFFKTMDYFKDNQYVKMCYDCGHNHLIDPEFDYLTEFKDKIICLHLHDNMGRNGKELSELEFDDDNHTLNKYGTINWDEMAKKLARLENDVNLDYELLFNKKCPETMEEVATIAIEQAKELEEKIKHYKN